MRGQRDFEKIFEELKGGAIDGILCSNLDRPVRPDNFADYGVLDHFRLNAKNRRSVFECSTSHSLILRASNRFASSLLDFVKCALPARHKPAPR